MDFLLTDHGFGIRMNVVHPFTTEVTMYGWQNEAGEPIMSGEAYRFEQALDAEYAEQRGWDDDDYYSGFDYRDDAEPVDPEDCDHGDAHQVKGDLWECDICDVEFTMPEDAFAD